MFFRFLPIVAVMAIIFFLSHTPGDNLPSILGPFDKLCHATAYATLALSCLYAIPPARRNKNFFQTACAVVLFCLLYGISDEFHQSFIAGRYPDWHDLVADTAGPLLAVIGWRIYENRFPYSTK